MKKLLSGLVLVIAALFSSSLMAAPGEWWEITSKMDMEGMPFAMPAQANKVCMPKGGQSDPNNSQSNDRNCKMTDVKHSGNTVKFKGTCVDKGETMHMVGETSHDANSFKSNMKMTGKSQGRDMNMAMVNSGKRIGGACDTEEMGRKMKAQAETQNREMNAQISKICDTSNYKASDWAGNSANFMGSKPLCTGKQDAMCKALRKDVPNDLQAFQTLQNMDRTHGQNSPAKVCNIDMTSTAKSLCKARANKGPLSFLESSCPAEAKRYRELERKRDECGERGYTSGAKMKQCMGGQMIEEEQSGSAPSAKSKKHRADAEQESPSSSDGSSEAVRQGTKALKGLLGF